MTTYAAKFGTDWVAKALASRLDSHEPVDLSLCSVEGPLFERQNSRIFCARRPGLPGPAALKICLMPHTSVVDGQTAREEFEALQRTHAAMAGSPTYSVPEPYLLDEAHGLLAMEWIVGDSMTSMLLSGCSLERAENLMHSAAEWLHRFHAAGRLAPGYLNVEDKLREANDEFSLSPLAKDPIFSQAIGRLRETAHDAGAAELDRSWIHGDFKTDNLIVADDRTIGLDIHARMENVVLYDIAAFLNNLDLGLLHPRAWRLWRGRTRLREAFLMRYRLNGGNAAVLALCWIRLLDLLSAWMNEMQRQRPVAPALASRWLFRRVSSEVIRDMDGYRPCWSSASSNRGDP